MDQKTENVGVGSIRFWVALAITCLAMMAVGFAFNKAEAAPTDTCTSAEACQPKAIDGSGYDESISDPPTREQSACLAVGAVSGTGAAAWTAYTGGAGGPMAAGAWSGITSSTGCYAGQAISD